MVLVLHRWRPAGGWVTLVITCWILFVGSDGLRPLPGASSNPSIPFNSNRFDQSEAVFMLTPIVAATSASDRPSARSKTMRARNASRWVVVEERTRRWSSARSSDASSIIATGRAMPQYGTARLLLPAISITLH